MQHLKKHLALIPALLAFILPAIANAEDESLWEIRFAAFGRYGEAYPASKESQVNVIPLPFPIYRGKILRIGDDTEKPVRTRLFRWDKVKLDIDFGLNFPVDSDDIDARTGMPDLNLLAEAGPELEIEFTDNFLGGELFLALQARGAVSFDGLDSTWRGSVFSSELKHKRRLWSPHTELLTRITPEIASQTYMDFFYGVSPEFATLARQEYKATSGYLGTKLSFSIKHAFSKTFEIRSGVRFGFYGGAANRNSPLFTDKTTSGAYVAFLWKFWESKRRATADP
jgi:outer membrane scaffolding protein for murein synthesis (MipA/OmpV family)